MYIEKPKTVLSQEIKNMESNLKEAMNELKEKEKKLKEQEKFLQNLDTTNPLTEEEWSYLCKMGITTTLLCELAKNIFPEGNNFRYEYSRVRFDLYGLKCGLPVQMNNKSGVEVDLSWAYVPKNPEENYYNADKEALDMINNGATWKDILLFRAPEWKNVNESLQKKVWEAYEWDNEKSYLEAKVLREDKDHKRHVAEYHKWKNEYEDKAEKLVKILPILHRYTDKINAYFDASVVFDHPKIEDIVESVKDKQDMDEIELE